MRRNLSWLVLSAMGAVVALQPGGCAGPLEDPGTSTTPVDLDLLTEVLVQARQSLVLDELGVMQQRLAELDAAVDGWAAAPTEDAGRVAARTAYRDAVVQWSRLEIAQIGPAASSLDRPGGQDLRDEIYSWPTVNPCRVDQETVTGDFASDGFFESELVNVYGLDALEHLLYAPVDNACPSQVDINGDGLWDDLGPDGVAEARAAYAEVVVDGLESRVAALQSAWEGAFGDDLTTGTGVYSDAQEALDDVFRATFYVEVMKDEKLAFPAGLRECGTPTCPELAESQQADLSGELLRGNLAGLRTILAPGEGAYGFVDLLRDAGEEDLADRVVSALDDAEVALEPLDSVRVQVDTENQVVVEAHDAVAALATLLESEVAVALSLTVPQEAAGDAD